MSQRRYIQLEGIRLSYLEQGTPTPGVPSLLILHGLIASARTFNTLAAHLPDRHIVTLDMPGNGLSDRPEEIVPSFAKLASLVARFSDEIGLYHPVVIGHSHGGAVSLRLAVDRPDWPHALILLCPAHPFSQQEERLVRFYLSPLGRLFARSLPLLPRWLHLFAFRRMPGSRSRFGYQELAPYLETLRTPGTISYMLRLLATWEADMDVLRRDLLRASLSTPTLLLWGERDIVVPASTAKRLLEHLQRAELITMRGLGHLPNEESPKECANLIKTWLIWREKDPKYATASTAKTLPQPSP